MPIKEFYGVKVIRYVQHDDDQVVLLADGRYFHHVIPTKWDSQFNPLNGGWAETDRNSFEEILSIVRSNCFE